MFTTCPAAALASSHAHNVADDDALDNALRDRARDAKPSGTPHCKNACSTVHMEWKKARSSLADRRADSKTLCRSPLCAGPRATLSRQLTPAAAADGVATAPVAAVCRSPSLDSAGSPASSTNAGPHAGTLHCNSGIANAWARTAVHSPSADNAWADADSPLAADRCAKENDVGSRELLLPLCKSRSEVDASLRGVFALVLPACQFTRCASPAIHVPRRGPGQSAFLSRFQSATDTHSDFSMPATTRLHALAGEKDPRIESAVRRVGSIFLPLAHHRCT